MYLTTIAGFCCSKLFDAKTKSAPTYGSLIRCKHCHEIIELSYGNSITTELKTVRGLTKEAVK